MTSFLVFTYILCIAQQNQSPSFFPPNLYPSLSLTHHTDTHTHTHLSCCCVCARFVYIDFVAIHNQRPRLGFPLRQSKAFAILLKKIHIYIYINKRVWELVEVVLECYEECLRNTNWQALLWLSHWERHRYRHHHHHHPKQATSLSTAAS